ncbi:MAG: tetratricopeptide repeat protein [Rhodobacteraceae bacterium]|nr:tetratricopeptide repeat protein [Paracoccaceae bacterium]
MPDQPNSRALVEIREGPKAPKGTEIVTEAVDGLIVGHRLMAAGEYELALKAYHRAANEHGLKADVLSAIGSANLKLGRLTQAKELLLIAVEKDDKFVPAWNNLGVVLQTRGEYAEAKQVFQLAYGLDNGNSEEIRQNLTKTIAILEDSSYSDGNETKEFELVRRGNGRYLLLQTPNST